MKRFLLSLLTLGLAAALAAFALTPVAVRQTRLWHNGRAVSGYREAAGRLTPGECDDLLAQARAHNQALDGDAQGDPSGEGGDYAALLNPAGDGTMAVLEIPKAGIILAVAHGGGSDGEARVAHVPQSPLPCAGAKGPCLLQATRERFYDPLAGLDRLMAGDCFFLRVLQETWTYQVTQVAVEAPDAMAGGNAGGAEECALVAAAGDGEARLVVRGRRVARQKVDPRDDSRLLPGGATELILAAPVATAGLVLLALIEGIRRAVQRHRRRRMKL